MATYKNCIILYWNQGKTKRTILLNKNTNTPLTQTASGTMTYQAYSAVIEAFQTCTAHSHKEYVLQRPNHQEFPTDSNKYIANENLLLGSHHKKEVFEEVSGNEKILKLRNIVMDTPTNSSDMSKIEHAGPLTFEPCPEMTHKEQHVHVASDKQAKLMHWQYGL